MISRSSYIPEWSALSPPGNLTWVIYYDELTVPTGSQTQNGLDSEDIKQDKYSKGRKMLAMCLVAFI